MTKETAPQHGGGGAGAARAAATVTYGMESTEAMTKATAPMTGGVSTPPLEAFASTAAASSARKPVRFMAGIVTTPGASTLLTALPLMLPKSPLARVAHLALPP